MDIKGSVCFKVNGLNIEKLLNNLNKQDVSLYNVVRKEYKKLNFSVSYLHSKKVIACLDNMCYNYQITASDGIIPFFKLLYKRTGLIAGLLLFVAVMFASTFFISEIKVYGCKNIDPQNIISSINSMGVSEKSFNNANCNSIERAIYEKHDNVAFVSASFKGLILYIKIVETEPIPVVIDTNVSDIVASFKGKINRLLVFQGTPLVKAGDNVEKGQVLIGGYRLKPDGTQIPVRAMGEAYGVVELNYSEIFENSKIVLSRTGKVTEYQHIEFYGMNFPQKNVNIAYNTYETETHYSYIFKNNFLPARLVTVKYFETESCIVTEDFERVKKILIPEAEKKAVTNAQQEGKVISFETVIKDEGKIKYINTKVLVEKSFL